MPLLKHELVEERVLLSSDILQEPEEPDRGNIFDENPAIPKPLPNEAPPKL